MTSSIKRAQKLHRRHHGVPNGNHDQISQGLNFEDQWEELVISFDRERGDFTIRTSKEAETAELCESAGHRVS